MKSIIASVATICTLLVSDGLQGAVSADSVRVGIVPAVDVPAPAFTGQNAGRGGQAARIELEGELYDELSAWYRLAYVQGGTRLQVFEDYANSTLGADSDILRSASIAWQVANQVVEPDNRSTAADNLPLWAHVRTGNNTGPSAGLLFTLFYIDLLTPGALVGNLRVAGTGGIAIDGVAFSVSGIDVKIATALLTQPDVIFIPGLPTVIDNVTIVESQSNRVPDGGDIADWLNLSGFEHAGRGAASNPGKAAVVLVHDVRQALAWLCGRTDSASVCAAAQRSAGIRFGTP
jgi:hypothetical protein